MSENVSMTGGTGNVSGPGNTGATESAPGGGGGSSSSSGGVALSKFKEKYPELEQAMVQCFIMERVAEGPKKRARFKQALEGK